MSRRATLLLGSFGFLLRGLTAAGQVPTPTTLTTKPAFDVILRLDGTEIPGRVLLITPTELRYLAQPPAGPPAAGPAADTLRLPVANVFLVRYANGTHEVLSHPTLAASADSSLQPFVGLSAAQRESRGRRDALHYYTNGGAFWASFGSTLYVGPLLGVVAPAVIGGAPVRPHNLRARQPLLLRDTNYARGYQQQANRSKRSRAWSGYGVATGLYVVLIMAVLASLNH